MTEGHKNCLLVAENEIDYNDWVDLLSKSVQSRSYSNLKSETAADASTSTPPLLPKFGTLRALERKSPELIKYAEENDYIIGQERKENRLNICTLYPDLNIRKG